MNAADYYPAGAYYDPNAPYNQAEVPERDFDVFISQTLSRETTVSTNKYTPEYDEENGHTYANTEDTDWKEVYDDNCLTPLEIIARCKKLAIHLMDMGIKNFDGINLKFLIEECDGWTEDETEIFED